MTITLEPELESALNDSARQRGTTSEALALDVLRERFLGGRAQPRDEWERRLRALGKDCGVSPSDEQLGREALYE